MQEVLIVQVPAINVLGGKELIVTPMVVALLRHCGLDMDIALTISDNYNQYLNRKIKEMQAQDVDNVLQLKPGIELKHDARQYLQDNNIVVPKELIGEIYGFTAKTVTSLVGRWTGKTIQFIFTEQSPIFP